MDAVKDIALNENNDIIIKNGDFLIDYSDEVHVEQILKSAKGSWKQYPLLGVHLIKKTNMPTSEITIVALKKEMKIQLEYDNYRVNKISLSNLNNAIIDCDRIN